MAPVILTLVGEAVARRVWGDGRNTRIEALVMTGGPYPSTYRQDDYTYMGTNFTFRTFFGRALR
jgi:hypothetical protein